MSFLTTLPWLVRANRINALSRSSLDRILEVQARRWRELIRYAAARSPFYRDLYRGLDLRRCRLEDLPTVEKAQAMARFDDWVTDPAVSLRNVEDFISDPARFGQLYCGKYIVLHTSGSQGQPVVLLQTRACLDLLFQIQTTRGNVGGQTGIREAVRKFLNPARIAIVTMKDGFYPTAATFAFFPPELNGFAKTLRLAYSDPHLVERLNEFGPTNLTAYATVLLQLADAKLAGRLRLPQLRQVVNNSELLTDAARERLQDAFGVPVMNNYAAGECMHLSTGCSTDPGVHVNADWSILEVVDAAGRPVPPGERGSRILVTNLVNRAQPIIRYVIHDAVTWATTPCRCGNQMPRLARIDGRGNDTLWMRDQSGTWHRLEPMVLKAALHYCTDVLDWRVEQQAPNQFRITVVPVPGLTVDEARLRLVLDRQFRSYQFESLAQVECRVVAHLEPDPATGKVRRVVCTTGPDRSSVPPLPNAAPERTLETSTAPVLAAATE